MLARTDATRLLLWGLVCFVTACGAKTGLRVPDAGLDAGADAELEPSDPPTAAADLVKCVELTGEGAILPLSTDASVGRADVALLVDVSGSMGGEIAAIRRELRDVIVPGIEEEIPEVRLSVASFSDFPFLPYGAPGSDAPFRQRVAMTGDIADIQGGVDGLSLEDGRDHEESHTEALYQLATGEGLGAWIAPSFGCATGGYGYPCFRPDALPVILMFTDAPMHEGPTGAEPYDELPIDAHDYNDARAALVDRDIRVITFFSGQPRDPARRDHELLAEDTGALDGDGDPFVFDIGTDGRGLGDDVIDAIKVFAANLFFDEVSVQLRDVQLDDDVDATAFVERVVPVRARPRSGVGDIDEGAGVFRDVRSGTSLVFEVELRNDAVVPGKGAQRFQLAASFLAEGRDVLGEVMFQIVVPGENGEGCEQKPE